MVGEIEVEHAWFDPGHPVDQVDFEYRVHLGERDHNRRAERDCPACEPGSGASRHDRAAVSDGDPADGLDFFGGRWETNRTGDTATEHRGVVAHQRAVGIIGVHSVGANNFGQRLFEGVGGPASVKSAPELRHWSAAPIAGGVE